MRRVYLVCINGHVENRGHESRLLSSLGRALLARGSWVSCHKRLSCRWGGLLTKLVKLGRNAAQSRREECRSDSSPRGQATSALFMFNRVRWVYLSRNIDSELVGRTAWPVVALHRVRSHAACAYCPAVAVAWSMVDTRSAHTGTIAMNVSARGV